MAPDKVPQEEGASSSGDKAPKTCRGCIARGNTPAYLPSDQFTPSHVPCDMKKFKREMDNYLPLLPVAYHEVDTYKTVSNRSVKTGDKVMVNHIMLGPLLERDLQSKYCIDAMKSRLHWRC